MPPSASTGHGCADAHTPHARHCRFGCDRSAAPLCHGNGIRNALIRGPSHASSPGKSVVASSDDTPTTSSPPVAMDRSSAAGTISIAAKLITTAVADSSTVWPAWVSALSAASADVSPAASASLNRLTTSSA